MKSALTKAGETVDGYRGMREKLEDLKIFGRLVHEARARRALLVEFGGKSQVGEKPKDNNLKAVGGCDVIRTFFCCSSPLLCRLWILH